MLRLFKNTFIFGEATSSHFLRVTTSTQQLNFRSRYFFRAAAFFSFFRTATFSQQLFFQNSFFFRANIHFLRIRTSLSQLLFGTAVFSPFSLKISKKNYFFKAGTSAQYQLFQKSYILEKATFSGEPPFSSGCFLKIRHLL